MHIQCKNCNYCEKTDKGFFIKLIGTTFAGGGFGAWVTYFFAGTGFALPICIAIVSGGVAMLAFSDTIVPWISKRYDCPKCKNNQWIAIDDEAAEKMKLTQQKLEQLHAENVKYKSEIKELSDELIQRKNKLQDYIKKSIQECIEKSIQENFHINNQNSYDDEYVKRLENDFDFLMEELENKENTILELLKNQEGLDDMTNAYSKQEIKMIEKIKVRFRKLYMKVSISNKSYKRLVRMNDDELLYFEQEIKKINDGQLNFRDNIYGTDVKEVDFNKTGRMYLRKIDNCYNVVCVGNKNTQDKDIDWLKRRYSK